MPRVAAEGGDGLCGSLTVGVEPVIVAAVAARADQIAYATEPATWNADAIAMQVLVPAARALHFLFFEHANASPAVHRQAVELGEGLAVVGYVGFGHFAEERAGGDFLVTPYWAVAEVAQGEADIGGSIAKQI